jgi:membrane-associated phospholipid phosphatase
MPNNKFGLIERIARRMLPFDHLTIAYCWIIIILTLNFARPIGDYYTLLAYHMGAIILILILAQFGRSRTSRITIFFRLFYPLLLMTFFYRFSGDLVNIVVNHVFDSQVTGMEKSIIGVNLTLWLDNHLNTFMTELMSAAYFSYYLMIPGLAFVLFFDRRDREIKLFVTATCATFFISYLMFILYPVIGPRFHFAELYQNDLTGPFFRKTVNYIIDNAAFRGGAMPSSHVAEAFVVMVFAIRSYRRKAYFMIPVVIGLALGTVYGRFHYLTDVFAGILIGIIGVWMSLKYYRDEKEAEGNREVSVHKDKRVYVSNSI